MNKPVTQDILINAKSQDIFRELIEWGESLWWPKHSLMKFINLSGETKQGTVYWQKVGIPLGPGWHSRNETIDTESRYIKRVFLDGMFSGFEEIKVERLNGNCKVVYIFNCIARSVFNRFLWKTVFYKMHMRNIDLILDSLKDFMEKK